jgi:hypothetical protein
MALVQILSPSAFLVIALCCSCFADEPKRPSREDCEALQRKGAELAVSAVKGADPEELARHRENLARTGGEEFVTRCVAERSREYVACALAATTREELARCR